VEAPSTPRQRQQQDEKRHTTRPSGENTRHKMPREDVYISPENGKKPLPIQDTQEEKREEAGREGKRREGLRLGLGLGLGLG
jgi:hypothetical protein